MTENRLYEMIYELYDAIRDDLGDGIDEYTDDWIICRTSISQDELSECRERFIK